MTEQELHQLADLVADRLADKVIPEPGQWLSAAQLAEVLGVSRECVYENADSLGALRIGEGPRARLRFPPPSADGPGAAPAPRKLAAVPLLDVKPTSGPAPASAGRPERSAAPRRSARERSDRLAGTTSLQSMNPTQKESP